MHFALVTNILVLEMNALKAHIQTSAPHSYTCTYQRFSSRTYSKLLLIGTHLRKQAVATSRTHLQVRYTHKLYTQ